MPWYVIWWLIVGEKWVGPCQACRMISWWAVPTLRTRFKTKRATGCLISRWLFVIRESTIRQRRQASRASTRRCNRLGFKRLNILNGRRVWSSTYRVAVPASEGSSSTVMSGLLGRARPSKPDSPKDPRKNNLIKLCN